MKRPPKRGDDTQLKTAEQQARVVELRRQRMTFAKIGNELGVTPQRAHQIYVSALKAIPALQVDQHRTEELALADDAVASLWPIAHDITEPKTAIDAWNSIRGWSERKARLLGLDAVTKVETDGTVRYELVGIDPALLK